MLRVREVQILSRDRRLPNLIEALNGVVRQHRPLTGEERTALKRQVSDRVRELVPYGAWEQLDNRVEKLIADRQMADQLGLSSRECEVLVQVMLGKGNREIADELVIAESTVKSHVDHVLRKLGARNRFHAVVLILHRGASRTISIRLRRA